LSFTIKAVGRGLGSILAVGGVLLLVVGTTANNAQAASAGWTLIIISVLLWLLSFAASQGRRGRFGH